MSEPFGRSNDRVLRLVSQDLFHSFHCFHCVLRCFKTTVNQKATNVKKALYTLHFTGDVFDGCCFVRFTRVVSFTRFTRFTRSSVCFCCKCFIVPSSDHGAMNVVYMCSCLDPLLTYIQEFLALVFHSFHSFHSFHLFHSFSLVSPVSLLPLTLISCELCCLPHVIWKLIFKQ